MINKLKNILKNKKGMNTIETAIVSVIILMCIGGMIDLNTIIKKFNATSSTTSYISRTIAKQGGVRMNKPQSFNGNYVTSQELYSDVKSALNKAGIKDSDFQVTINGNKLQANSNLPIVTHGKTMKVELKIKYKWSFISQFNGGNDFSKSSNRVVMSTFKYRTSSNVGSEVQ